MKNNKLLKITLITIIISALLFMSLDIERPLTKIEVVLKEILLPINKIFTKSSSSDQNYSDSYLIQKNLNISMEQEIKELKDLLDLKNTHSEFEKEKAKVISRNNQFWLNSITIDKGSNDGIKTESAVITSNGLVGKISKTTPNFSEVKLLTSDDVTYKTSVVIRINEKDYYAILNGYDKENNLLKVTAIDKNIPINENDSVLTSGLGNMPRGIYIGKVISSKIDNYDLSKTLYVKTEQDFNSINYVTILKEKINWSIY